MNSRDSIILQKISNRCKQIEHACTFFSNSKDEFYHNDIFTNSVSKCIEQIGELCKNLSDNFITGEPDIPWKSWCRIRDRIAHQYDTMDLEIVWDTIQHDVPLLETKVAQLLEKTD